MKGTRRIKWAASGLSLCLILLVITIVIDSPVGILWCIGTLIAMSLMALVKGILETRSSG
jgi:hypothetical protein